MRPRILETEFPRRSSHHLPMHLSGVRVIVFSLVIVVGAGGREIKGRGAGGRTEALQKANET